MCGRYYVDDETAQEIERLVRQVGEKMRMKANVSAEIQQVKKGDIYPTNQALIMNKQNDQIKLSNMKWGFQGYHQKGVVFNAKSETVTEKRMFRDSICHRRCIIPATGFYEWNKSKEKVTFTRQDDSVLFLAGFWNIQEDEDHFVILTTEANQSMIDVHERMPLILEQNELTDWIFDDSCMDDLLRKTPVQLKKAVGYEQVKLPFI